MPRGTASRLPYDTNSPAQRTSVTREFRSSNRTPHPFATLDEFAAIARVATSPFNLFNAGTSHHRLFLAWYTAGVDTVRCAYSAQSLLVRQMFEVSPVSLALQYLHAFHDTSDTIHADTTRALA